jgi:hypothetical protein
MNGAKKGRLRYIEFRGSFENDLSGDTPVAEFLRKPFGYFFASTIRASRNGDD